MKLPLPLKILGFRISSIFHKSSNKLTEEVIKRLAQLEQRARAFDAQQDALVEAREASIAALREKEAKRLRKLQAKQRAIIATTEQHVEPTKEAVDSAQAQAAADKESIEGALASIRDRASIPNS